nr:immunoglobulin heavy chain junction region [Mus musculus]MBK4185960.1 immunoglobulin heavy chain junction region [Mus musculus]MBK4185961.1 immunoglobulin heavy chain junction region [Mus musculus]MBK4185965.1 immunoglobulin heavy chain junction region [Mus musculus]MBK4185966.1 immunoglobulin heavy chain junction region [Mus musculus]
CARSYFDFW